MAPKENQFSKNKSPRQGAHTRTGGNRQEAKPSRYIIPRLFPWMPTSGADTQDIPPRDRLKCLPVGSYVILLVFEDLEGNSTQESENAADDSRHNLDPTHLVSQVANEAGEYRGTQDGNEYLRPYFAHLWH